MFFHSKYMDKLPNEIRVKIFKHLLSMEEKIKRFDKKFIKIFLKQHIAFKFLERYESASDEQMREQAYNTFHHEYPYLMGGGAKFCNNFYSSGIHWSQI